MEELPFVDDHTLAIHATPDAVWRALLRTARKSFAVKLPRPVLAAWGIEETKQTGRWDDDVATGDTLLGFHVGDCEKPQLLSLRGRHRFASYELRFELDASNDGEITVHAKTFAIFPGALGRIYRALVIGTGGHRIVVRRMLRSIARRASRA
jgi:hypothetical protein